MDFSKMSWWLTKEAVNVAGIASQALAVIWVWADWKMGQYQHADWRKAHRGDERAAVNHIRTLWSKFGGAALASQPDWELIESSELEAIAKEFPTTGDDDALKQRKIGALTPRYGVGPNDSEFIDIETALQRLARLRRGVVDYRLFVRTKTIRRALGLILIGLALQAVAAWPGSWIVHQDEGLATDNRTRQ
jgi:hypothetical protein